ncbi:MAG: helix-turn-helix domain-containing protein, partial [Clostridia bacterium]|nr:helix-turn-helix domain-containing protein [Clostridia bacterium]
MNIEIANRLVELRKQKGLSQEELAERLGISRQAVSKWERAESSPEIDNVIVLSRLYGVSIDQLLCTDMEPAATEPGEEPVRAAEEESELSGIVNLVCRVSGNVELKGSDGESHSVTLTGGERAKDACRVYTEGDTLYIVSEDERRFTLFNFEKPLGVTAVLPRNMARIEVRLKGGRLRMNGIDMRELDAMTGGGSISAEDCTANELKMKTGGGSISVRDVAAGTAEMKTGGGGVSASGLSASESVTAETGGGGVCVSCEAPSVLAR